ncbi:MAG: hypothetical protein PVG14_20640 [Anaerolineales bacterium]|jgi:hypothetical protein
MAKIFVRERGRVGRGEGRPRFVIVGVEGSDLKVYTPHIRKVELEKLAQEIGADIISLPRGESAGEKLDDERGKGRRRRQRRNQD